MLAGMIEEGRALVARLENYGRRPLHEIPPEERIASSEVHAWVRAAETAVVKQFGEDSDEYRKWVRVNSELGDEAEQEIFARIWDEVASAIRRVHTCMGLLTEFELVARHSRRASRPRRKRGPQTIVLFVAADPTDATRLRLQKEFHEIQQQLKLGEHRRRFKLALPQLSVRARDIAGALLDAKPHIVHFSGHGTADGSLQFEDVSGRSHPVKPAALAKLFEQFSTHVRCVLLNACYSDAQAKAIVAHIPHVIGMDRAIGDAAAIAFATGFYQALGAGTGVEEAYRLGCV